MRRLILCLLAMAALAISAAAQQDQALSFSTAVMAVKITNPEQQLTVFAPLLARAEELRTLVDDGKTPVTDQLLAVLKKVTRIPGINAQGDFWIIIPKMPDMTGEAANQPPTIPGVVVLPLANAQQFTALLATDEAKKQFPPCQVLGQYAVISLDRKTMPNYAAINNDLRLISKRDVVLAYRVVDITLPELPAEMAGMAGPMMQMISPMMDILKEAKKNIVRGELGVTMIGDDLSLESYQVPVPGSKLEKELQDPTQTTLPAQLAGYLPENLAYCSASGPRLPGAPGAGYLFTRMLSGMMSAFLLPEEAQEPFTKNMTLVTDLCSQGRALGITAPPAAVPGPVSLVAAYHVANAADAKKAMDDFVQQVAQATKPGAGEEPKVQVVRKEGFGKVGPYAVDLVKIVFPEIIPDANGAAEAAPTPLIVECYLAYVNDVMLFAAYGDSKTQIIDMVNRVRNNKPGFTISKRYTALKTMLPTNTRSFESYASQDLVRTVINLIPMSADTKVQGIKLLSTYPAQRSVIYTYTQVQDGNLHGDVRLPGEQLDFIMSMCKLGMQFMGAGKQPGDATLQNQPPID